jgi:hypothetical protein
VRGLGRGVGISATPLRLAFVLLSLIGGPGLILYLILWLIMPYREAPPGRIDRRGSALELDDRTPQFLDRG